MMDGALIQALLSVWAAIQGEYWLFWALHWQSKGRDSYARHLLFERLYTARREEIDRLAELIAALAGSSDALDPTRALGGARAFVEHYQRSGAADVAQATAAVVEVLRRLQLADEAARGTPYALGAQNVLAGIADKQMEALYLLQQAGTRSMTGSAAPLGALGDLAGLFGASGGPELGAGYVPRSKAGGELQRAWGHLGAGDAPVGLLGDALGMLPGGEDQARTLARGLGVAAVIAWAWNAWTARKGRGGR